MCLLHSHRAILQAPQAQMTQAQKEFWSIRQAWQQETAQAQPTVPALGPQGQSSARRACGTQAVQQHARMLSRRMQAGRLAASAEAEMAELMA